MNNDSNQDLFDACCKGDVNAVDIAIAHGATNWNRGLCGACFGGHIELANLMISNGATDWNKGLLNACEGGYIELVKLMIAHGANYWNMGLFGACEYGHIEIVKLLIEKGANDFGTGLIMACRLGNIKIAKLMIEYGATNWREYLYWCNSKYSKEFIKAQWKLHDKKATPIIRLLRRYIKYTTNAKRIQRWWRYTYPLWRELAYAPPKGRHYLRALDRFTKASKS